VGGRSYVYYVHEVETDRQPWAGRTVTMTVKQAPGSDAAVAPSDAAWHATGPPGQSASGVSGDDGLVFFILTTSATPGENDFVWKDDTYDGLVVVLGVKPPRPSGSSGGGASGSQGQGHGGGAGGTTAGSGGSSRGGSVTTPATAARAGLPQASMPPLAAGLLAVLLVFLLLPPVLARRPAFALVGGMPAGFEAG